jgi:hypothetical protein
MKKKIKEILRRRCDISSKNNLPSDFVIIVDRLAMLHPRKFMTSKL